VGMRLSSLWETDHLDETKLPSPDRRYWFAFFVSQFVVFFLSLLTRTLPASYPSINEPSTDELDTCANSKDPFPALRKHRVSHSSKEASFPSPVS